MIPLGVTQQGLGHIARLQHMARQLVIAQIQRLRPLLHAAQVLAVHIRLALVRLGAAGGAGRNDGDAGQARTRANAQGALRGFAQRIQGGVAHIGVRQRDHQNRHFLNLLRRQGTGLVVHAGRFDPTLEMGFESRALGSAPALGDRHLIGMGQIKRQVRGRGVTLGSLRLQAAQNNFLQPFRHLGAALARWLRVHPQTLAQTARGLR